MTPRSGQLPDSTTLLTWSPNAAPTAFALCLIFVLTFTLWLHFRKAYRQANPWEES